MTIHEAMYVPGPHDLAWTKVNGIRFQAGKWVELDTDKREHCIETPIPVKNTDAFGNEFTRTQLKYIPMGESLAANPFFEVREKGGKVKVSAEQKRRAGAPETAEEYKAYALKWIEEGTDPDEMKNRWRREQPLRDRVGAADAIAEEIYATFSTKVEMMEVMAE